MKYYFWTDVNTDSDSSEVTPTRTYIMFPTVSLQKQNECGWKLAQNQCLDTELARHQSHDDILHATLASSLLLMDTTKLLSDPETELSIIVSVTL